MTMNFLFTPEQQQIHDAVADFARERLPVARLHHDDAYGGASERAMLREMADLGWFGLGIPEALGGVGYGAAEDLILFREAGRRLASPIVLATRIGAEVAARAGDTALAARILSGERVVAMARAGWTANLRDAGTSLHITDGMPGELVLVWTRDGAALFEIDDLAVADAGAGLDQTLIASTARIGHATPRAWHGSSDGSLPLLARTLAAASLAGIAEAARDEAVAYAKVRVQFGKVIGTFQAIQHRCADMAVAAEVAWAQCIVAALSLAEEANDAAYQVAAATTLASRAAIANARGNIQVHGGMGYSAECDAHLYMKRAHYLERLVREDASDIAVLTGLGRPAAAALELARAS